MSMDETEAPPGRLENRYRAFLETVTSLRPRLHRYCARMTGSTLDGEDVVQDALFDAYRRLESYDASRPIGPGFSGSRTTDASTSCAGGRYARRPKTRPPNRM